MAPSKAKTNKQRHPPDQSNSKPQNQVDAKLKSVVDDNLLESDAKTPRSGFGDVGFGGKKPTSDACSP
jgi:hypothetical protein